MSGYVSMCFLYCKTIHCFNATTYYIPVVICIWTFPLVIANLKLFLTVRVTSHQEGEYWYSKTCVKWPLSKRPQIGFQDQSSLKAGQKYCRMLQREHSAVLLTFIKLPFVIKIFVLSILSGRFTQALLYT